MHAATPRTLRSRPDHLAILAIVALLATTLIARPVAATEVETIDIMVFTETEVGAFRHDSIDESVAMFEAIAANETLESVDFTVTTVGNSRGDGPIPGNPAVGDGSPFPVWPSHEVANVTGTVTGESAFTDEDLADIDVVVFASTVGDQLDDDEKAAFQRYIRRGGGYLGIHAAADTGCGGTSRTVLFFPIGACDQPPWPWYQDLVGGWFSSHPAIQEATSTIEDLDHVAAAHVGPEWTRTDEWYNYRDNPRGYTCYSADAECAVNVLMSLDESTFSGGDMGDHPITWCNEWDGGRAFYTGMGHTAESFADPAYVQLITGGLLTVANVPGLADSVDFAESGLTFDCEPGSTQPPVPEPGADDALLNATVTALPSGNVTGFAPPHVVMQEGGQLELINLDSTLPHDVRSVARGANFKPLFISKSIPFGETAIAEGAEALPPGTYAFVCSIHGLMTGELTVVATP